MYVTSPIPVQGNHMLSKKALLAMNKTIAQNTPTLSIFSVLGDVELMLDNYTNVHIFCNKCFFVGDIKSFNDSSQVGSVCLSRNWYCEDSVV